LKEALANVAELSYFFHFSIFRFIDWYCNREIFPLFQFMSKNRNI